MSLPLANLSYDIPVLGPIGVAAIIPDGLPVQVLPADNVRHALIFHNPGTNNIRVAPANLSVSAVSGTILIYPQSELIIFPDDDELINVNCAWNALADSGLFNPLTIFNFTDNNQSVPAPEPLSRVTTSIPVSSPQASGFSVATSSGPTVGTNPVRRGISFHNPGTVNVAVSPANIAAALGAGSMIVLPGQTKTIMAKGRRRVNCAWNAIAASSSSPLTILEYL